MKAFERARQKPNPVFSIRVPFGATPTSVECTVPGTRTALQAMRY